MDEIEFIDMGQAAERGYQKVDFTMGDPNLTNSLYVPLGVLTGNLRIDMNAVTALEGLDFLGTPFEVTVYQTNWETPELDFSFAPLEGGDPPAVMMIDYAGADLAGLDENLLMLYRYTGTSWEEANLSCGVDGGDAPLYELQRFQEKDLLAVPICQTGIYALSDYEPVVLIAEAEFSADPSSGLAPLSVHFTDSSVNATIWEWDFGDGSALSYEQNPTHEYSDPGIYTVILTVGNGWTSDMETKVAFIMVFDVQLFLPMLSK